MVIILRGISGSGKSTLARFLKSEAGDQRGEAAAFLWQIDCQTPIATFSTDTYFMFDGVYRFEPSKLPYAHGKCLRDFTEALRVPPTPGLANTLIVDNTNCSIAEVAPYISLAGAYSHVLHIVTLVGDPNTCYKRGTHGVPFSNVLRQDMNLRKSLVDWPPWWAQQVFPINEK